MLSPPGGPRSNQPSGPRSVCATSQMCDPQRSGPRGVGRWGRCALRGWPQGHAPCALGPLRAARVAPGPRALRPGPCPSPHTQRCNFAIVLAVSETRPGRGVSRRATRLWPAVRSASMSARVIPIVSVMFEVRRSLVQRIHMTPQHRTRIHGVTTLPDGSTLHLCRHARICSSRPARRRVPGRARRRKPHEVKGGFRSHIRSASWLTSTAARGSDGGKARALPRGTGRV
jgi:hypothetical protein